jgi:[acyl-carrier-protein] S-malonyltransferase
MGAPWRDHPAWDVVERFPRRPGRDLAELLIDADAETLKATRNAQLAAFGLSLVVLEATRALGGSSTSTRPAVAGHSLGEYTALVAAEALTPEEGARLVVARGEAMQAAADAARDHGGRARPRRRTLVAQACAGVEGAWPANDNAPGQVVVAGTRRAWRPPGRPPRPSAPSGSCRSRSAGPFTPPSWRRPRPPSTKPLARRHFGAAASTWWPTWTPTAHRDGWADLLSAQLVSPVRWRESLLTLSGLGVTHFLELGPGSELSGMVKRISRREPRGQRGHARRPGPAGRLPRGLEFRRDLNR